MQITYTDAYGSTTGIVQNSATDLGNSFLYLSIDGIVFKGSSFDDFTWQPSHADTERQLKRFTFNEWEDSAGDLYCDLCNCLLSIRLPIQLYNYTTQTVYQTTLEVQLVLGPPAKHGGLAYLEAIFELPFQETILHARAEDFESGLAALTSQLPATWQFKHCFACQYSDYHPLGSPFFGGLHCFKQQKEAFLEVQTNYSKSKHLELLKQPNSLVQETYCCADFKDKTS